MRLPHANRASEAGPERRYLTIKHTIPDALDRAAELLDEALDLLEHYGLAEALQPDNGPYGATAEGLRAAANRVRAAAQHVPDPALSRPPEANTRRHTSDIAQDNFRRLNERADRGDVEAEAALIILGQDWAREKAGRFIDGDGIDFVGMLSAHTVMDSGGACGTWNAEFAGCGCGPYWSSGEALLLRLAWNLWSGDKHSAVDVAHLLDICDDQTLALAVAAIEARRGTQLPTPGRSRRRPEPADGGLTWSGGRVVPPQLSDVHSIATPDGWASSVRDPSPAAGQQRNGGLSR